MTESKLIVITSDVLPFLILAGIYLFMPGAIQSFFETPMLTAVFAGVIFLLAVGSLVVHKMLGNKIDAS